MLYQLLLKTVENLTGQQQVRYVISKRFANVWKDMGNALQVVCTDSYFRCTKRNDSINIRAISAKSNSQSTPRCTLTFWTLFEPSHCRCSPSDPAIKFSSILGKSDIQSRKKLKQAPFWFQPTKSVFYGWFMILFCFSRGVEEPVIYYLLHCLLFISLYTSPYRLLTNKQTRGLNTALALARMPGINDVSGSNISGPPNTDIMAQT